MGSKKTRLEIKDGIKITESDYRGLIAFTLTIGVIISTILNNQDGIKVLGPLAGWAAGWYFGTKTRRDA